MKRLLSGITPSGDGTLHIGNYLGAVKQFIDLARDHGSSLREIPGGLGGVGGPEGKITFFRQSDVPMCYL